MYTTLKVWGWCDLKKKERKRKEMSTFIQQECIKSDSKDLHNVTKDGNTYFTVSLLCYIQLRIYA